MEGQGTPQDQASVIDMDKLAGIIEERFKAGLKVFSQEQQQQQSEATANAEAQRQAAETQRLAQEQAQKDTFGQLLVPYVGPVAQQLNFRADDTKDFTMFYLEHPEALAKRQEIETQFDKMAKAGRAIPREDINTWLIGREKIQTDRESAAKRAMEASTLNAGADQRAALSNKPVHEMNKEELKAFLAGSSF